MEKILSEMLPKTMESLREEVSSLRERLGTGTDQLKDQVVDWVKSEGLPASERAAHAVGVASSMAMKSYSALIKRRPWATAAIGLGVIGAIGLLLASSKARTQSRYKVNPSPHTPPPTKDTQNMASTSTDPASDTPDYMSSGSEISDISERELH